MKAKRADHVADKFYRRGLLTLLLAVALVVAGGAYFLNSNIPALGALGGDAMALGGGALLLGLASGVALMRGVFADRHAQIRLQGLEAAFESDGKARLVVAADDSEIFRNQAARFLLGAAEAPLGLLLAQAAGDERMVDELARLKAAAETATPRRAEISVSDPNGGRLWLAVSVQPLKPGAKGFAGAVLWCAEDVTARRALEETLKREYESISDFLDYLPIGSYSADTEGRLRFVNQRLAEWLGRSAEDLAGADLGDIFGFVPNPETERAEVRVAGRGGDGFNAFVSHTVFDDGGETFTRSVVVRDMLPEKQWERALKSADRRFRWLFDDAPVGIALLEPDGTVAAGNLALQLMMGLDADDLVGRPVSDFVAEDYRPLAAEELAKVAAGSILGTHLELRLIAKRDRTVSLFVSPTHEDRAITGLVVHFIDTTEQKNLELQFAQSQKMQAMGQLAGGVAHDFNNLLTAMIGFCDLLLQRHGAGDPSFADIMQIRQNANRAASLVRQLLAFSRRQALQPRLLNVTDALAELSNLLRRLLGETIELKMVHGRDLGLIRVDPGQFDQVIINLAVNARDAMPGGGTLTLRTAAVTVERPIHRGAETMPPGDYVMIEVADTGTGIPKEDLGRIFEPFFSTKAVGEGTGLGLSTVYGIVRQTDGFVFVESQAGEGAAFLIYLPRIEADAAAEKPLAAHPAGLADVDAGGADLTGIGTVLLVEDEDAVRLFGARALRNKGYHVIEARSGEGALDVLRAEDGIDILVTDVVMPGMDGVTLARLVRIERPQIRIILISGYSEDVAQGGIAEEEGLRFLPKPFSLAQLAGAVKEAMGTNVPER